jgi:hypothetical protein
MPEAKNNFIKGRMNKDLDERLLQKGEYRDARNVSVSNSETGNSGSLENVLGSMKVTDFGLTNRNLEIIGAFADIENDRLFFFITNYTDSSPSALDRFASPNSAHYIFCYNVRDRSTVKLVQGSFLNFSKTHPIIHINLLEDLLFWTDNRNQPRKINVNTAIQSSPSIASTPYYSKEEHISVAKYYPWNAARLYKRSYELDSSDPNYGRLNTYNHSLIDRVTTIFDSATLSTSTFYDVDIVSSDGLTSGDGDDAQIRLTTNDAGNVSDITVLSGGTGFAVGDTITIIDPTGLTSDEMVITLKKQDFWIEPTMRDTTSKVLPYSAIATTPDWGSGSASSSGVFVRSDATQDLSVFVGCLIFVEDNTGAVTVPISDGIFIETINANGTGVNLSGDPIPIASTDKIYIGANPHYSEEDIDTISNIKDKFVRFAYRFKYDDNEYSLISPFTQPIFVPKQDGHFTGNSTDIDLDEQKTIKSTTVSFFENKITEAEVVIDLPEGIDNVSELVNNLNIKEVDILYKDATEPSIKVVKTIKRDDLLVNTNNILTYTYKSTRPVKVLPEREITRVFDKVPVRAYTQESAGNRIVYGNYLKSFAPLDSLDYEVTSSVKSNQGGIEDAYSKREYPNHTLKQNRTYQVGVVLADKFGRRTDPIISEKSTVFSKYKTEAFDLISSTDIFRGDALNISFNQDIPDTTSNPLYKGIYNADTNPMGWYSYHIVVKQQETSYYNAYVPSILNGYPVDVSTTRSSDIAHITLHGENINKIPRDFTLGTDSDEIFRSDTTIYPRVSSTLYTSGEHGTSQFSSSSEPSRVNIIGTRNELGLQFEEDGTAYSKSPFYSIPDVTEAKVGSNPLIGRISTSTSLGSEGGTSVDGTSIKWDRLYLDVVETKPFESNLELFWETSSSGLISDLNADILSPENSEGIPYQLDEFEFLLSESSINNDVVSNVFTIQDFSGTDILNASTTGTIISARNKAGVNFPTLFTLNKNVSNKFFLTYNSGLFQGYFGSNSFTNDNYDITMEFTNTVNGEVKRRRIVLEDNLLINREPTFAENGTNLGDVSSSVTFSYRSPSNLSNLSIITDGWKQVSNITISNGSINTADGVSGVSLLDLNYNIDRVEWYNTFNSTWYDYWYYLKNPNSSNPLQNVLVTRDPNGLIKLVYSPSILGLSNPFYSMKMLYSPIIEWGEFDNAPTIRTSGVTIESTYTGETPVFTSGGFSDYIATFAYSTNNEALQTPFQNNGSSIPAIGIYEPSQLRDKSGFLFGHKYVDGIPTETGDMQFRVTFTLYDANRNGIAKQFTALFDVEKT